MSSIFTLLLNPDGSAYYPGAIRVRAKRGPVGHAGGTIVGSEVTASTNTVGFVTLTLLSGDYRIWIGDSDPRTFTVPEGDGPFLMEDLLGVNGSAASPLNYRYQEDVLQLINGTDGSYSTVRLSGATEPELAISAPDTDLTPANYEWRDTDLWIWNDDAAAWQQIYLTGATTPQLAITGEDDPIAANARLFGGKLQFLNADTNLYHTLYLSGTSPQLAIGPGEV